MTRFTVLLADCAIDVTCIYNSTKEFCKDYLTDKAPEFSVCLTQREIDFERENFSEVSHFSDEALETLALYRAIADRLIERDVLLLHGSAIDVDGRAYIFTAPSGTGKSTHARLWRRVLPSLDHSVTMINDDKPLLKVTDSAVTVCGTPWNGVHRLGANTAAPLKSICILTRDSENHIEKISASDAFPTLFQRTYKNTDPSSLSKIIALIEKATQNAGLYRLGCNMKDEAALVSYNAMK